MNVFVLSHGISYDELEYLQYSSATSKKKTVRRRLPTMMRIAHHHYFIYRAYVKNHR